MHVIQCGLLPRVFAFLTHCLCLGLHVAVSVSQEKFLVDKNGEVTKRFSPKFETIGIADDIGKLLES